MWVVGGKSRMRQKRESDRQRQSVKEERENTESTQIKNFKLKMITSQCMSFKAALLIWILCYKLRRVVLYSYSYIIPYGF